MSTEMEAKILAELASLRIIVERSIAPRPVLPLAEAMELAGCGSRSAFQRWCQTWRVKACGQGRYARRAVLAGLDRESSSGLRRRRTPEKSPIPAPTP